MASTYLQSEILTPAVEKLVGTLLGAVPRSDINPIATYRDMVQTNAVVGLANDLRILLGLSLLGEFTHPDSNIQEFGRDAIANFQGSFLFKVAEMLTFIPFGYSFTEKSYKANSKGQVTLDKIQTLEPSRYRFEGTLGRILHVNYVGAMGEIKIPYEDGIHLIHQPYLAIGGDPYGVAACKRAVPYWELLKIIQASMAIAGKRQATPILVGKTDTSADTWLLNPDGSYMLGTTGDRIPVNQGYSMLEVLKKLANSSVAVIDRMDEMVSVDQQTDGSFFMGLLHYIESALLLCFLIPRTVVGTSLTGTGDSNLNEGHRETFGWVLRSQMTYLTEALIEKMMRPMIEYNFGAQHSYGVFPVSKFESSDSVVLLDVIGRVLSQGGFSPDDAAVIDRMKKLAGIA